MVTWPGSECGRNLRMSWTLTHHSDCSEVITCTGAGARPSRGELGMVKCQ